MAIPIGTRVQFSDDLRYREGRIEVQTEAADGSPAYEVRDSDTGFLVWKREAQLIPCADQSQLEDEWREESAESLHRRAEKVPLDSYVQMEEMRREESR